MKFLIKFYLFQKVEGKTQSRKFSFDTVFDPNSVQDEVFNYSGIKRLINMAIDGYICTCFAYGQTGSGKTYTMCGPSGSVIILTIIFFYLNFNFFNKKNSII